MKIAMAQQLLESARRLIAAADRTAAPALTQGMLETLVWAQEHDGYVVAGHDLSRDGSRYFFSAGSVRALGARGLAELKISPDGGVAATLTDAGRAHDVLAGPVGDRLVSVDGGEPVSLREFAKLNEGLDLFRYVRLKVDDTIREGGGAAARFKIKRVAARIPARDPKDQVPSSKYFVYRGKDSQPKNRDLYFKEETDYPLTGLYTEQKSLSRNQINFYVAMEDPDEPIVIHEHKGIPWIENGHHRAAAAIELGRTSIPALVYVDRPTQSRKTSATATQSTNSDLDSKTATEASTRKAWDQSVLPVSPDDMNGMDDDERRALLYEELCRAGDLLEAVADAFRNDLGVDRDAVDQAAQDVIQLAKRLNLP